MRNTNPLHLLATLVTVLWLSACADSTLPAPLAQPVSGIPSSTYTLPPVTVTAECDPYLSLNWCKTETCLALVEAASQAVTTAATCAGTGTGGPQQGTGGGGTDPFAPQDDGPGAFLACVGGMLGLMMATAMIEPLAIAMYDAAREYHSARRMYEAVMANSPSLEMEQQYAYRLEAATANYHSAMTSLRLAAGASAVTIGAVMVACLPAVIAPTI